jgi:peptide-methionine (R)-S-oxide reductase
MAFLGFHDVRGDQTKNGGVSLPVSNTRCCAGTTPSRAWTSPLNKEYRPGTYLCAGCDLPLFSSSTKFDSKTGWPSFWAPIEGAIETSEDRSFFFLVRTEVHCHRCGSHLGHVFNSGPQPAGLRYCMNGVALKSSPSELSHFLGMHTPQLARRRQ